MRMGFFGGNAMRFHSLQNTICVRLHWRRHSIWIEAKEWNSLCRKRSLYFKFDSRVLCFIWLIYVLQHPKYHQTFDFHEKFGKLSLYLNMKAWVLVLYILWSKGKLSESTWFVCLECLTFCWINVNALLETDCSAV